MCGLSNSNRAQNASHTYPAGDVIQTPYASKEMKNICDFAGNHYYRSTERTRMNLIIALLMLVAQPKEPKVFYYSGNTMSRLQTLQLPPSRGTVVRLLVYSPFELRAAWLDKADVEACLPKASMRKALNLEGRWYMVTWEPKVETGSSRHTLYLEFYHHRPYEAHFVVNVEGSQRVDKPTGVN